MSKLPLLALTGLIAVVGVRAGVLWEQATVDTLLATIDQEFLDYPDYSTYQVNDFATNGLSWRIAAVSTYFTKEWGQWSPSGVAYGRFNVFPKVGALPEDGYHPQDGVVVPISLFEVESGWQAQAAGLDFVLDGAADYWIGLTPVAAYGLFGQEFHWKSGTMQGDQAAFRDAGASGVPEWRPASDLGYGPFDTAFKIEGVLLAEPADLNCDGKIDAFDIDPFVLALTDTTAYAEQFPICDPLYADLTGDGQVDAFDVDRFVALLTGP
jgi:hypothetical protein